MNSRLNHAFLVIAFCSSLVNGQDSLSSQPKPDAYGTALQSLRLMADDYRWSHVKGAEDRLVSDDQGKVLSKSHNTIELTRAGNAFRFVYDQHYSAEDSPIVSMVATFTYDGRTVRTISQKQGQGPSGTIGVYDLTFLEALSFWPLFGVADYIRKQQYADYLMSRYSPDMHGTIRAQWLDEDFDKLQIVGDVSNSTETIAYSVRNGLLLRREYRRMDSVILEVVAETQIIDGKKFPRKYLRSTSGPNRKSETTYEFSEIKLLKPQDLDVGELVKITPQEGAEIVDRIERVAYRVTATGRQYLPYYDNVTGKTTLGPATATAP